MKSDNLLTAIEILKKFKSIAIVGISNNPERPSYKVAKYLIEEGYDVVGVNPGQSEILERPCYRDLASIPHSVDVVDVFRAQEYLKPIIEDAIKIKAQAIWLQEGLTAPHDEDMARTHGLLVVHDICMKKVHATELNCV